MHLLSSHAHGVLREACARQLTLDEEAELTRIVDNHITTRAYPFAGGEVNVVLAPLGPRTVVSVARVDHTLWMVIDAAKPECQQHVLDLIDRWPIADVALPGDCMATVLPLAPRARILTGGGAPLIRRSATV